MSLSRVSGFVWGRQGGECWFMGAVTLSNRHPLRPLISLCTLFFVFFTIMAQVPFLALPGTPAHDLFPRNTRGRPLAMQHVECTFLQQACATEPGSRKGDFSLTHDIIKSNSLHSEIPCIVNGHSFKANSANFHPQPFQRNVTTV